jgi:1,4-alpha-glucan branching enzyme
VPLSQDHIADATPLGGTLLPGGGATFRAWAPAARRVWVLGDFNGWEHDEASLLVRDGGGRWAGFVPGARAGQEYLFHVEGEGSEGPKRDPYARELTLAPAWPHSHCILVDPAGYPWHDAGFRPPPFADLAIYQLHVGRYWGPDREHRIAKLLDLVDRIEYLAALGVNAVQLLPVVEFQSEFSLGYNGTDYFSPEMDYEVADPAELAGYWEKVNALLAVKGQPPLAPADLRGSTRQLQAVIDLCHLHGLAVHLDVVYNHAGGGFDDESLFFFDRQPPGDNERSLYFTRRGWAGGLVFAYHKPEVRQFLIDNAVYFLRDLHADGLRYDEVSVVDHENEVPGTGWRFCQDLTDTVRFVKPEAVHNAEYWPVNPWVVRPRGEEGAGFDVAQHDALRIAVRNALKQAAWGGPAVVDMGAIAAALAPPGFAGFRAVQCVENHDRVYAGPDREPRIPALADPSDHRSWYARSRSRVAAGLVLTAPGIPMLFMGQELLENRPWHDSLSPGNLVRWEGLEAGDPVVTGFLHCVKDLLHLRRRHPALRRGEVNAFHGNDAGRVLAFHRWIEGEGRDVVVVASLCDETYWSYELGFPRSGEWSEVFNSDVFDSYPNPQAAGNGGRIEVQGSPRHGLPASAAIVIPANAVLVFARDPGD